MREKCSDSFIGKEDKTMVTVILMEMLRHIAAGRAHIIHITVGRTKTGIFRKAKLRTTR